MSSRIACCLNGHDWYADGREYGDMFDNTWAFEFCQQCRARRRYLVRRWDA